MTAPTWARTHRLRAATSPATCSQTSSQSGRDDTAGFPAPGGYDASHDVVDVRTTGVVVEPANELRVIRREVVIPVKLAQPRVGVATERRDVWSTQQSRQLDDVVDVAGVCDADAVPQLAPVARRR